MKNRVCVTLLIILLTMTLSVNAFDSSIRTSTGKLVITDRDLNYYITIWDRNPKEIDYRVVIYFTINVTLSADDKVSSTIHLYPNDGIKLDLIETINFIETTNNMTFEEFTNSSNNEAFYELINDRQQKVTNIIGMGLIGKSSEEINNLTADIEIILFSESGDEAELQNTLQLDDFAMKTNTIEYDLYPPYTKFLIFGSIIILGVVLLLYKSNVVEK